MGSGPGQSLAIVSVKTTDVPNGPRAHVRHTAKSTISDHFDPLIQSSLQLCHTTHVLYGYPLDLQGFRVRNTPQSTFSP